jgi:hypothetical protein
MPDPLPVLLLGRIAIDQRYHNQGFGQSLLRDAMLRAVSVAGNAGVFAILVHALSEPAKQFYLSRGFVASPLQPMTLIIRKVLTPSHPLAPCQPRQHHGHPLGPCLGPLGRMQPIVHRELPRLA